MMRKEGYNTYNMKRSNTAIAGGVLALLVLCLASCQSDEIESGRCNIVPEFVQQQGTLITTRALLSGYTEYTPAPNNVIYAYAQEFETGTALVNGDFSYNAGSSRWNSTLDLEIAHKYYLYAYQRKEYDICHNSVLELLVCHSVSAVLDNKYLIIVLLDIGQGVNKHLRFIVV